MIIGISGLARSGKDTAAGFLVEGYGFVRVGLADKIKRILKDVFDFTDEQLWGSGEEKIRPDYRYKRAECPVCGGDPKKTGQCEAGCIYLTARFAATSLGTGWARTCYPDVWVDDVLRTATLLLSDHSCTAGYRYEYEMKSGLQLSLALNNTKIRGIVIPDVRFKNEMSCIRAVGGHLIRLKRGPGLADEAGMHQSETEQLEVPDSYFTAVIDNNKLSLEELREEVCRVYINLC